MTAPWMAVVIVTCLFVIVLSVLVIGLLRRITPLLERAEATIAASVDNIAGVGALGVGPGTTVAPFNVSTLAGRVVPSSELLASSSVLLFMNRGCSACHELARKLDALPPHVGSGVPWHVVVDEVETAVQMELRDSIPVLVDAEREALRAFNNRATPQAYFVNSAHEVIGRALIGSADDLSLLSNTHDPETSAAATVGPTALVRQGAVAQPHNP